MDQPRTRRAAKSADKPEVPEPAAPLDETDPELEELPTRPVVGARSGEPLFSPEEAARFRAAAADVSSLRLGPPLRAPMRTNNVYRARRPGVAVLLMLPTVGAGLLLVRALAIAAFGKVFSISGVLASCLALAALPLFMLGLYGLITGAAYNAEQLGFRTWARPPLAYLLVSLTLLIAAGLAIS